MKKDLNNLCKVVEFALIVTLQYFNVYPKSTKHDPKDPGRVVCYYERTSDFERIVSNFFSDSLKCSPRKWHSLSRDIKAQIRAELTLQNRV